MKRKTNVFRIERRKRVSVNASIKFPIPFQGILKKLRPASNLKRLKAMRRAKRSG
jgi:hypothetical protein